VFIFSLALYGEYFLESQNYAYNLWNVMVNFGFFMQFSISTLLCMYTKLYLQLSVLTFAMLAYGKNFVFYVCFSLPALLWLASLGGCT